MELVEVIFESNSELCWHQLGKELKLLIKSRDQLGAPQELFRTGVAYNNFNPDYLLSGIFILQTLTSVLLIALFALKILEATGCRSQRQFFQKIGQTSTKEKKYQFAVGFEINQMHHWYR